MSDESFIMFSFCVLPSFNGGRALNWASVLLDLTDLLTVGAGRNLSQKNRHNGKRQWLSSTGSQRWVRQNGPWEGGGKDGKGDGLFTGFSHGRLVCDFIQRSRYRWFLRTKTTWSGFRSEDTAGSIKNGGKSLEARGLMPDHSFLHLKVFIWYWDLDFDFSPLHSTINSQNRKQK